MLLCSWKGDAMDAAGAWTGCPSANIRIQFFPADAAVLQGTAVFFCSTRFPLMPVHILKSVFIFRKSASALWRVRFSAAGKKRYPAYCQIRAPPLQSWIFKKISRLEGKQIENKI